jgi:hypothetical protein
MRTKTLMIAALATVAFATSANAAEMPRDIIGNWCYAPRYDLAGKEISTGKEAYTHEPSSCDSDRPFTITRRSFGWEDGTCTVRSVRVRRNATWTITAKCDGQLELYTFEYNKGTLYVQR